VLFIMKFTSALKSVFWIFKMKIPSRETIGINFHFLYISILSLIFLLLFFVPLRSVKMICFDHNSIHLMKFKDSTKIIATKSFLNLFEIFNNFTLLIFLVFLFPQFDHIIHSLKSLNLIVVSKKSQQFKHIFVMLQRGWMLIKSSRDANQKTTHNWVQQNKNITKKSKWRVEIWES
jgi:hypothetical protein